MGLKGSASIVICLIAGRLAACGPVATPTGGEDAAGAPGAAAPAFDPASLAAADLERGELLGLACLACHTLRAGEPHNIGPNLAGIFGRPAAAIDGFGYSAALATAGIVWSPAELDAWLRDPAGFVPGSTMAFAGYRDAIDRRDLIAWLVAELGTAPAATDTPGTGAR